MFTVTDTAREKILERMAHEGKSGRTLRVRIAGWTADDFEYRLEVIPHDQLDDDDVMAIEGELPVALAADSVDRLSGATLDFIETARQRGFSIENPNPVWADPKAQSVQRLLDDQINPGVGMHGGRVTLMELKDDVAYIRFDGGCVGCGLSNVTLKQGVDRTIREHMPEIRQIVDVTDHDSGTNPFYTEEEAAQAQSPVA
jgi:Fe/S biogenesis protein NfuA